MEVSPTLGAFSSQKRDDQVRSRNPEPKISQPKGFCLASFVPGTKRIWSDLCCTFQHLTRWRCVPEGRRESRPAIYRRYWCFRICSRPGGTIEIFVAEAIQFSKDRSSLGHERRYSGVPPGRRDEEPSPFIPFGHGQMFYWHSKCFVNLVHQ
jgi:hypothetical protein